MVGNQLVSLPLKTVIRPAGADTRLKWSVVHTGSSKKPNRPDSSGPCLPLPMWHGPCSRDCGPFEDVTPLPANRNCQELILGAKEGVFEKYMHENSHI